MTATHTAEASADRKKIVVGTTLPTMAMGDVDAWSSWLKHAERQQLMAAECGYELRHFAAIQVDARGIEPFAPLLERLAELGGEHWVYSLDDGRTSIGMTNRWRHITVGQNLVTEYCQSDAAVDWLLFLAADCAAPSDIVPRMLEMKHPLCAPYISTYGLRGTRVAAPLAWVNGGASFEDYPWPVEECMASAAAIFIARSVFRRIRWRWDLDDGMSDDPCFHHDAQKLLGMPTFVRMDVLARHYPEAVGDYESRGYDTAVVR